MFKSDERKSGRMEMMRGPKTFAGVIVSLLFIISILIPVLAAQSADALAVVDKSGLDILCNGEYLPCKNGIACCIFKDGSSMCCSCKTGACTSTNSSTVELNPPNEGEVNALAVDNLLILKGLTIIIESIQGISPPSTTP